MLDVRLTPSSLGGYAECPRRAVAHRFVPELEEAGYDLNPDVRSVAPFFGNAVHTAAALPPAERAAWLAEDTGAHPGVMKEWLADFQRADREGGAWEFDDKTPDLKALRVQAEKVCLAIDAATGGAFWSDPSRWDVEQDVSADIGTALGWKYEDVGFNIWLRGRFDFYDKRNNQILDVKTGGGYTAGDHGLQLAAYRIAMRANNIDAGSKAHIVFARRHKYTRTTPEQHPAQVQEYDLVPYVRQARRVMVAAVEHTVTFFGADGVSIDPNRVSANPKSMLCSPKYCRLHGTAACDLTQEGVRRDTKNNTLPQGENNE